MISMLIYSHEKRELKAFDRLGREIVSTISDDDWDFLTYNDKRRLFAFLEKNPVVDLSCIEVADSEGVSLAERLRQINREMYMILLTEVSVSPALYIRPTIMPSSLLLRPLQAETVKRVFLEAFQEHLKKYDLSNDKSFLIEGRDGRQLIPYSRIRYFESREKKIYINAGSEEYSFYDTLDKLEQKLPEGFLRCHRSFIVAQSCIRKILLSQSMILLDNGDSLPLSRTYKSVFKELK